MSRVEFGESIQRNKIQLRIKMAKYSVTSDTGLQVDEHGPTNEKPEYTLDEVAAFFAGRTLIYQEKKQLRTATSISSTRTREIRRMLVRNNL